MLARFSRHEELELPYRQNLWGCLLSILFANAGYIAEGYLAFRWSGLSKRRREWYSHAQLSLIDVL